MMYVKVLQLQNIDNPNEKITRMFTAGKPIEMKQNYIIEAENRNELRNKVLKLLMNEVSVPRIFELNDEAKDAFQILKLDNNNMKNYSDESFLIGKTHKLTDPDALFEIVIFKLNKTDSRIDRKQLETIRIIGRDLHQVVKYKKYFLQLHTYDGHITSITNRIPDTISIWPEPKYSLHTIYTREERLKNLREKLRKSK